MNDDGQQRSTPTVPPGRRGWLAGMVIACVVVVALIIFLATRSGGAGGSMPGMDMGSGSGLAELLLLAE